MCARTAIAGGGPGYQLNIKTTGYPKGTYILSFTVSGDPTVRTLTFVIR